MKKLITVNFYAPVLFFTMLFCGSNANAQFDLEPGVMTVSQSVTHEYVSTACGEGNYSILMIVNYTISGVEYSSISSTIDNMGVGTSGVLYANVPVTATITGYTIRIDCDYGLFLWDLASNLDDHIEHPSGGNWLNCPSAGDYIHVNDLGNSFLFYFTTAGGTGRR